MTAGEFRAWMDGFLIGKTTLTRKDVETIRAKSQEVREIAYPVYPSYPVVPWWGGYERSPVPLVDPTWVVATGGLTSASASDQIPCGVAFQ